MKPFYRKKSNYILGVIEGIGEYTNIDANILRMIIVATTICFPSTFCIITLIYVLAGMIFEEK
jgi:phage shock protein PspC (stress-responsive transcriptional regulator)